MAKPLTPTEGMYLYWRNDNRRYDRDHKSGAWYKGQMARARRRQGREEVMAMLERDLVDHKEIWEGLADA